MYLKADSSLMHSLKENQVSRLPGKIYTQNYLTWEKLRLCYAWPYAGCARWGRDTQSFLSLCTGPFLALSLMLTLALVSPETNGSCPTHSLARSLAPHSLGWGEDGHAQPCSLFCQTVMLFQMQHIQFVVAELLYPESNKCIASIDVQCSQH